ncbi:MAG: hypothetical protein H7333_03760 [Bdellovibrionales bacterium]|nr:hypothetical protein [Oligoflexia bacterium]
MKIILIFLNVLVFTPAALAVDLIQIEKDLAGNGVQGTIHGAVEAQGLYVFSYRSPTDFFDHVEMSLVSDDAELSHQLETLNRHDLVLIQGSFLKNPSPQKHILLSSLKVVKKFDSGYPVDPYHHEAVIPDELLHLNTAIFLVHAVAGDGHVLVTEYKDSIVPFYVKNAALTRNLFRNDLVKLKFVAQENPGQPLHLLLDDNDPSPLVVIESIQAIHGKPGTIEGALVLFPQSPEIIFNVFAVDQPLDGGLKRQYTIVNFEDPALFKAIRDALQAAWDRHAGEYVNGRNKLVSTRVWVRVSGVFNEVSANQANPQILVSSLADVKIIESAQLTSTVTERVLRP